MRTCFVPFCDGKNKDQPNRTMFLVPREPVLFAQWADILPKVRTLRSIDRICHLHFRPEDVVYTFDHIINGQIYKIQRDRPRLKPDALPCLEMTTKEELLSYRVKHRLPSNTKVAKLSDKAISDQIYELITEDHQAENEQPTILNVEIQKQQPQVDNCTAIVVNFEDVIENVNNDEQTINDEPDNQLIDLVVEEPNYECDEANEESASLNANSENLAMAKLMDLFNLLYDNVYDVLAPNTLWGIHRCPNRSLICFSYMDVTKFQFTKMININVGGSVQLYFYGSLIRTLQLCEDIDDLDSMAIVLNHVDMWRLCFGKSSNSECEIVVEPNDDNCWSTDDNDQVFLCKICLQMN
ncbi:uncharacterized protein LOC135958223 [Calliphora vicina]|uniref:uncharacterized protein LOC135958223 n=1 Tax=Calliphora vicina TaxID=7373 RepID=UPI00325A84A6